LRQQSWRRAREEFPSLPCPVCEAETLQARGELGWERRHCGATDSSTDLGSYQDAERPLATD
jgi:hypothetical protein